MFKRFFAALCFLTVLCVSVGVIPVYADTARCRVEVSFAGNFSFSTVGQPITVTASLEGSDTELAAKLMYTQESKDFKDAIGFRWIDLQNTGTATAQIVPESSGIYCFAAEIVDPATGKTVSSLETSWCTVLVIDPAEKLTVTDEHEFEAAIGGKNRYISVEGDLEFDDWGVLAVDQQTVLEITEGSSVTLRSTELALGSGSWDIGSTLIVSGTLNVGEGGAVSASDRGAKVFLSGDMSEGATSAYPNITVVYCNTTPFEAFEAESLADKDTGITAFLDGITNYTVFRVSKIAPEDQKYRVMSSLDDGEVLFAFQSNITEYEGSYTVSVPVGEEYEGKKMVVCTADLSVSGSVEPEVKTVKCQNGAVQITVDKYTAVMVKAPTGVLSEQGSVIIAIGAGAALLIVILFTVPALSKKAKDKKAKKEE